MDQSRREFLMGTAWMGAAAMAKPFTVDEIDMSRFDFGTGVVKDKDAQTT